MNKNIINNAQLLEIKTKIRQLGAMMNAYQCRFVVSSGQLFFVDDEYAGTVKLTNLDNGESNISFPSCDFLKLVQSGALTAYGTNRVT